MTQPSSAPTTQAPTEPTIVKVIGIPFTRRLASPSAQEAHLVVQNGAICGAKSESWQPMIEGVPLCDACRQECLRRMASKIDSQEEQERVGWEPDTSHTCGKCGCRSVVDGVCTLCGATKDSKAKGPA